ncbi:hypothetical protein C9374_001558 [Naegleria lovaniensis]|uniref:Uncharacterized protein n=1 Tax=Naegleria lovaniensis TaxID=51637 RepID=A0AA88GRT0_NAELO|nr:uncharacterized protein C9374_001558 [Naegleria lovaniensis]KAG2387226.1 hypothetical protein C9374_001558 [Naegleria lovaniensis]
MTEPPSSEAINYTHALSPSEGIIDRQPPPHFLIRGASTKDLNNKDIIKDGATPSLLMTARAKKTDAVVTPNADQELDELEDVMHNTVSGAAPGADTSKHAYCAPRRAIVTCQNLEVISEKLKERKLRICVYIKERVYKRRKTLRSSIIDVPNLRHTSSNPGESVQVPLNNISFKLKYSHHFKKKIDVLRISLQYSKKKGDSFKTMSIVSINLLHVLQRPFDENISFLVKKKKKKSKEETESTNTAQTNHMLNSGSPIVSYNVNSAILHYLSSDDEDDEKERYQHHQQVPTSSTADCVAKLKVSIQTVPISLTELRKKKRKFTFLGKKEDSHAMNAIHPGDPYEGDFTDEDEETDEDSDIDFEENNLNETNIASPVALATSMAITTLASATGEKNVKEDKTLKAVIGIKDNIMKRFKSFKKKGQGGQHFSDFEHDLPSPKGSVSNSIENNPFQTTTTSVKIEKIPIQDQVKDLLHNKTLVKKIILINGSFRRGQRIWSFLKRSGGLYAKDVLCTFSCEDVHMALTTIIQNNTEKKYVSEQELNETKIVIIGNDAYVNDVLRACLAQTTEEKQWDQFLFYIVPIPSKKGEEAIHRSRNEISAYLNARCPIYAQLFSADEWKRSLSYPLEVEDCVEQIIFEYLENARKQVSIEISQIILVSDLAQQNVYPLPHTSARYQQENQTETGSPNGTSIATASQNFESVSQQCIVPLINNVHIVNGDYHEQKKPNILLKLVQNLDKDTKEKTAHKVSTTEKSLAPSTVSLATSPQMSSMGNVFQKRPSSENPVVEDEDSSDEGEESKQEKTSLLEMKIDYWDASNEEKSKSSTKNSFSHVEIYKLPSTDLPDDFQPKTGTFTLVTTRPKKKKKPVTDEVERKSNLTKIICKVEKKKSTAKVVIDGVEWANVKVVSVAPSWVNNFNFKVACFK